MSNFRKIEGHDIPDVKENVSETFENCHAIVVLHATRGHTRRPKQGRMDPPLVGRKEERVGSKNFFHYATPTRTSIIDQNGRIALTETGNELDLSF